MGMYTAIMVHIKLKDDTPKEVIDVLNYMVGGEHDVPLPHLPDHYFFMCDRWEYVFRMRSCYFDFDTKNFFDGKNLISIANLKNYSSEKTKHTPIESFFDWIYPYCDTSLNNIIGCSQYEEDQEKGIGEIYIIKEGNLTIQKSSIIFNNIKDDILLYFEDDSK